MSRLKKYLEKSDSLEEEESQENKVDKDSGKWEDRDYVVEKIIDKKRGRWPKYLVKWQGWTSRFNSWLPIQKLSRSQELVDEYELAMQCAELHTT